jgi:hypothetical protein
VKNDAREADKVRVKNTDDKVITSITVIMGHAKTVTAEALDQYGDPMPEYIDAVDTSNGAFATAAQTAPKSKTVTITPVAAGNTTVRFYNGGLAGTKLSGTLSVKVSDETDVAKYKIELWTPATDTAADDYKGGTTTADYTSDLTIDISDDLYAVLNLNEYNVNNVKIGNVEPDEITITESKTGVVTAVTQADDSVLVTAQKEGTATVGLKYNGITYSKKFTVVDEGYTISSVDFKSIPTADYAKTYTYKTALTVTTTGNDPIIKGINLNKTASQAIRMDISGLANDGKLYIDKNGDGNWDAGTDTDLGTFEIIASGTFANAPVLNVEDGIQTAVGDEGTIIFKVWNPAGDKVLDSTSVQVSL